MLDKSDPNWLKCKIGDEEGLVPANYVGDNTGKNKVKSGFLKSRLAQIENPLHEASKRGNVPFLKELLSAGVSVHSLDRAKNTPLHWAARAGHPEAITLLLPHKPNLNAQNKLGDSPLHCAAWSGNPKCVELLLNAKGVDVTLRNADGALPVDIAKNDECAALLLQFTGTGVMDAGDLSDDDD